MRPRIEPIKIQGEIMYARKVLHFVNQPLHIFCMELIKTATPAGRVILRREEEVVYKTRVRLQPS